MMKNSNITRRAGMNAIQDTVMNEVPEQFNQVQAQQFEIEKLQAVIKEQNTELLGLYRRLSDRF